MESSFEKSILMRYILNCLWEIYFVFRARVHRPQLDMTGDPLLSGIFLNITWQNQLPAGMIILLETANLDFRFELVSLQVRSCLYASLINIPSHFLETQLWTIPERRESQKLRLRTELVDSARPVHWWNASVVPNWESRFWPKYSCIRPEQG